MEGRSPLREHVLKLLEWEESHVDFERAVAGLPPDLYGKQPEGLPYSPWQLLEHMRLAQADILEFCRNPDYVSPRWPDDYWPDDAAPPSSGAWAESMVRFRADRKALVNLARNPDIDLFATIPHGTGQTYLRELLLIADHNAYHVGQLVIVRRLLGAWQRR